MEINGNRIPLSTKAASIVTAMEARGWKYRIRATPKDVSPWIDFYKSEDCISAHPSELIDNWLLDTLVKYDPEIRQATIDAAFVAMCRILKVS